MLSFLIPSSVLSCLLFSSVVFSPPFPSLLPTSLLSVHSSPALFSLHSSPVLLSRPDEHGSPCHSVSNSFVPLLPYSTVPRFYDTCCHSLWSCQCSGLFPFLLCLVSGFLGIARFRKTSSLVHSLAAACVWCYVSLRWFLCSCYNSHSFLSHTHAFRFAFLKRDLSANLTAWPIR